MTLADTTATINGLTIGAGTTYRWVSWPEGLVETPSIRLSDRPNAGDHGIIAGRDLMEGRPVSFEVWVLGPTRAEAEANSMLLLEAFAPSELDTTLDVRLTGTPSEYRLYGRTRGCVGKLGRFVAGKLIIRCEFMATDPRLYSTTALSATTGLSTAVGGLAFPAVAPFVFGSGGTGSSMSCPNDGTLPTPWVATFTGPLVAPQLVHSGSGDDINLSGASIVAGETIVVDSAAKTVLLNGTTSRYNWLASVPNWFSLEPGVNTVTLLGASGSGSVSIAWRSAWI